MTTSKTDSNYNSAGSRPEDLHDGTTKQKVEEDAQEAKREAGNKAREKVETGQHRVADEANNLSDAIDAAASNLDDNHREGLARYARELSGLLTNAAGQLEGRSIDELANDAKHLARKNPTLFMLGSVAVGFGLSRFFKASAEREHDDNHEYHSAGTDKDNDVTTGTPAQEGEYGLNQTSTTSNPLGNTGGRNTL